MSAEDVDPDDAVAHCDRFFDLVVSSLDFCWCGDAVLACRGDVCWIAVRSLVEGGSLYGLRFIWRPSGVMKAAPFILVTDILDRERLPGFSR